MTMEGLKISLNSKCADVIIGDIDILEKYHEGLIALSGCIAGEVSRKILDKDFDGAKETILRYKHIFGKDNYFIELQNHGISEEKIVLPSLYKFAEELGVGVVATNDAKDVNAPSSVTSPENITASSFV